jgi:hypothetical protein
MGLQLRLSHALGERLIDLEARGADRPIVVGRASEAGVQVPSGNVSKNHCLLFVQQGQWTLKDAGSTAGTFLNGKAIRDAVRLKSGDVITLGTGSHPATIAVDPHRVGMAEESEVATGIHAPPPPAHHPPPAAIPTVLRPSPPGTSRSAPMPPPPRAMPTVPVGPPQGYVPHGAAAAPADERTGWEDTKQDARYYVPKRKKSSSGAIFTVAIVSLGIAVGGYFLIRNLYERQQEGTKPKVVVVTRTPQTPATAKSSSVFDFGQQGSPSTAPAGVPPAADAQPRVVKAPAPEMPATPEPPPDKRREDPEWLAVEQARFEEPVRAIVKLNDYRERFPDTPFKKDLDQYTDDAVDRLWWKRLVDLFAERDAALKEIADRNAQIKQSAEGDFRKGLEAEVAQWTQKRDRADEAIRTQMKFAGQAPPNLYDSQELAGMRSTRDATIYNAWKEQVLSSIRKSRGEKLPWKQSR